MKQPVYYTIFEFFLYLRNRTCIRTAEMRFLKMTVGKTVKQRKEKIQGGGNNQVGRKMILVPTRRRNKLKTIE